jgi:prepilin-type N-terminal cleavage/methylation domain-containing protein
MLTSDKGFTLVELLIAMAIVGIVLTGMYELFVTSNRIYLAQNAIVEMQADSRAAMDFMVRELRLTCNKLPPACTPPTIFTTTATNDTISFDRVEETGYSSGGNSATTLNDTKKSWLSGDFAPSASSSYMIRIIGGTGKDQVRSISSNSPTQTTVTLAWGTTPDSTSIYVITSNKGFSRTSTSDNVLRYRIGAAGDQNPLAENILNHSFSRPSPNTIGITLTGQTRAPDPITKQYRTYTLTEEVTIRNK